MSIQTGMQLFSIQGQVMVTKDSQALKWTKVFYMIRAKFLILYYTKGLLKLIVSNWPSLPMAA